MVKLGSTEYDTFADKFQFWKETISYFGEQEKISNENLRNLPQSAGFALDAGCGYGLFALTLSNQVGYVVGMDISKSMIEMAKKYQDVHGKLNVDFVVGDLDNLLFKKETFDFVVSNFAFYVTNLDVAIIELSQLLKPGGRMVINHRITRNPRLDAIPIWRIFLALKNAPKYTRAFGLKTMWQLLSFETSPAWIKYVCDNVRCGKVRSAQSFIKAYSHVLPDCRFKINRWRMAVVWDAPI
jgi:ubiquinone/menaquinone biosynthesis C-methylase UbiE